MDRIDTRSVRPLVQANEKVAYLQLQLETIRLELIWLERTGGTFGPGSAAFANYLRRSIKKPAEPATLAPIRDLEDRGQRKALVLYLSCPTCSRRCRVLYSRKGKNEFGCVKCNRPAYPSNCWPHTGRRNARGISLIERKRLKHEQAAKKIRKAIYAQNLSKAKSLHLAEMAYMLKIQEQLALLASERVAEHLINRMT